MYDVIDELEHRWNTISELVKNKLGKRWISKQEDFENLNINVNLNSKKIILGIAGPGACGKTTLVNELKNNNNFNHLINVTTRLPRQSEINGKDYYFLNPSEFDEKKENNEFIIDVEKSGRGKYSIYKKDVEKFLEIGNSKIIFIESPLIISSCMERIEQIYDLKISPIIFYLLPKTPIMTNLYQYISLRQNDINMDEILINHGWRQIEEFSSILSLDIEKKNIYILEGMSPKEIANRLRAFLNE